MDGAQNGQESTEKVGQEEVGWHGDNWKDFGENTYGQL